MPGFVTDADLLSHAADRLHKSTSDPQLGSFWSSLATDANNRAYQDIVMRLAQRGYTLAQIGQWVGGYAFQLDLGLRYILGNGALLDNADDKKLLDHLHEAKELDSLTPLDGTYKPMFPAGTIGNVTTGPLDTSQDLFILDPNDSRIGGPTRY